MKSILKYILLSGTRDRLYLGLFISLIISFSLSIFLGSTALVEQQQMTTTYIAGLSRGILVVGMILFVCLNINRAFENKEVEFIISKAISREQFVLGYLLGFFLAALLIMFPLLLAIFIIANPDLFGLLIWSLNLFLELMIIISFAFVTSLILKNSFSSIMASLGFYIISRLMGVFVLTANIPKDLSNVELTAKSFSSVLKILSVVFPRIDLFCQSKWLSYGFYDYENLKVILIQSLIYIPLLFVMAFHDFKKKQF